MNMDLTELTKCSVVDCPSLVEEPGICNKHKDEIICPECMKRCDSYVDEVGPYQLLPAYTVLVSKCCDVIVEAR
jgi:hypothetical protein